MIVPAVLSLVVLLSCGGLGKVSQGRVIEYDPEKGLITLIQDSNYMDPSDPKYDILPPVTIRIPEDPKEMGPAPEAGGLMLLDRENKRVVIFDPVARDLKTVHYTLVEEHGNVFQDDARVNEVALPAIDRENKTITVYAPRRRELVTFSVADEYLALPYDTWKSGDEVRYYYKDPGQALRLMNVTKMDST